MYRELESLDGSTLKWVIHFRYLGVSFASGRTFRCCYENAKSNFFRASDKNFGKVGRIVSEEMGDGGDQFNSRKMFAYFIIYAT